MKSVKHNYGERKTLKMRALTQEVGIKGFGIYWYLVEEIYEGEVLELNEAFFNLYAVIFQIKPDELRIAIKTLLKHEILIQVKNCLTVKEVQEKRQKRKEAGEKGMKARWAGHEKVVKEEPKAPVTDKIAELAKQAVANQKPTEAPKAKPKRVAKPKVTKHNPDEVVVSPTDLEGLDALKVKVPMKEWEFLPLFNEIKLQYRPTAKGHTTLTSTDKQNLRKLVVTGGYSKEDFTLVIHTAMKSKWVQENSMDIPNHVLRNDNFERYLNKADKASVTTFVQNETDKPNYK